MLIDLALIHALAQPGTQCHALQDGKHVVFGKVISGYEIVDQMQRVAKNGRDQPNEKLTIVDSGELPTEGAEQQEPVAAVGGGGEKVAQQPIRAEL